MFSCAEKNGIVEIVYKKFRFENYVSNHFIQGGNVKKKQIGFLCALMILCSGMQVTAKEVSVQMPPKSYDFTVGFAGDINLDEHWITTQKLDSCKSGIYGCISIELLQAMQQANLMCLNNEYTYSNRGKALEGKAYTFRANPSRVEVLKTMGVDVVSLANNHVYDYGADALLDTLATLENADIVIAYVHWGSEYSDKLEPVQIQTGHEYIDCGADIVIGAHSHCLQGMEFYKGKPIIYSLGNYWFNGKTLDTMLLQLHFAGENGRESMQVQILPAVQVNSQTLYADPKSERERIYSYLESISSNIVIMEDGMVTQK